MRQIEDLHRVCFCDFIFRDVFNMDLSLGQNEKSIAIIESDSDDFYSDASNIDNFFNFCFEL